VQNSIELNLTKEGFSIPKESMTPEHIFNAIAMLQRELYNTTPDHMARIIYERLHQDLETTTLIYEQEIPDDLPF
tara:strand:+ start:777 stop:1001 length:225 start_codon:yes stop_codon:yes gene_type:complete